RVALNHVYPRDSLCAVSKPKRTGLNRQLAQELLPVQRGSHGTQKFVYLIAIKAI
ncbi:MAG: hypothetical protein RIR81_133, partial [Actinomycetota bacterium]